MANTIRAAKNTFLGGLVMDLSPDTTPNEVLTSALNATLVTFNGNEMLLQNDMGNGRVETARLPEGYIPVGTCEFGDIIYIVSYNPLTNRSQIGCFPSPERNISSEEIGSAGQLLAASDFQVLDENRNATGELVTSSVKKIIYNNKMNPGDKYIIYDKNNQIRSQQYLTDLGNTQHVYGSFPRLYRIHVIAIEDSGKINFLDSTVRWYDNGGNDYFMMPTKVDNSNNIPDIDSYRDLLSSGYSVFQSKISGKLGLLIELEKINGFSCTYNVYTSKNETPLTGNSGIYTKNCKVYWSVNWSTTDNNINPAYLVLTKSEWTNKEMGVDGGKWFSWEYNSNKNKIVPSIPPHNPFDIPKAFGQDGYWNCSIGRLYDPTSEMSYDSFISSNSYDVKLNNFITTTKRYTNSDNIAPYKDVDLVKVNSVKQDIQNNGGFIGIPVEGDYYINLSAIEKTLSGYLAYTNCISGSSMSAKIPAITISDDVVNNYFNTSISKYFADFTVPVKQLITINNEEHEYTPNISNLIYHYEITPAMDYGLLREYSIEGYIDFSKIGTGAIDLTYWKYYNTQNTSTLSVGFDAYVEENKGIAEVVLEFYDNQGIAAAYHIRNKESYSGTFTEFIPLNGAASSPNLTSTDSNGKPIYHLGTETTKFAENVIYMSNKTSNNSSAVKEPRPLYYSNGKAYENYSEQSGFSTEHTATNDLYINDAGTIYSNALYLVKIIVKYCQKDALGNLDTSISTEFKTYYRWFWTNTMYNQYYSNAADFDTLPFLLNLDVRAVYSPSDNYHYESVPYLSPYLRLKTTNSSELFLNSAATVQVIATDNDNNRNNTKYYLQAGLSNTYNTFNLRGDANSNNNKGVYDAMSIDIYTDCDQYVENIVEDPDIVHAGQSNYSEWAGIKPIVAENTTLTKIGNSLRGVLNNTKFPVSSFYSNEAGKDIWEAADGYKDQINNFQVTNFSSGQQNTYSGEQEYIAYNNTAKPLAGKHYITKNLGDIYSIDRAGTFEADIIHYSKYYYTNIEENLTAPCLVPLLRNLDDLEIYGLGIDSNKLPYVKYLFTFNMYDDGNGEESHLYINKYSYAAAYNSSPLHAGAWEDNWDDSENHSVFGYDSGYFFRDKRDEWLSFKTPGFFLWGLSAEYDSKYSALCNFDPRNRSSGDDARWYHNTIGSKWATLYGTGEINNYATTDLDRGRAHSWNDSNGRQIAAVGYNPGGDKLEHYFNTMFLVEKSNQEVQFLSTYKAKYPHYIGQYIATILCGIYLYSTDEALKVLKTNDIVHMDNNYTVYTKDIVYVAKIRQGFDHNKLISLHDIHFDDYIARVKTNSGVQNNQVNNSNVTLTIQGCVKNNPIQYKLEYLIPKYDDLAFEGSTTAMVLKADGNKVPAQSSNFDKDKLYWLDENNTVLTLSKQFSAECVYTINDELGDLSVTYNPAWGRMTFPHIYKMFKWEEDRLVLNYSDRAPAEKDRFSIHGQEEEDFCIRDMRKDEILVPLGNMMRPEDIPI